MRIGLTGAAGSTGVTFRNLTISFAKKPGRSKCTEWPVWSRNMLLPGVFTIRSASFLVAS